MNIDLTALKAEELSNELETAFLVDTNGKELYAFSHAQLARFNKDYSVSQILLLLLKEDADFVTKIRDIEVYIKNLQEKVKELIKNGFNSRAKELQEEINNLLDEYNEILNTKLDELKENINDNKELLTNLEENYILTSNEQKRILIASNENLLYGTKFDDLVVDSLYEVSNQTFSFFDNTDSIDIKGELAKSFDNVPDCSHGNNILKITAVTNNVNQKLSENDDIGLQYTIDEVTLRAYHKTLINEGFIFSCYVFCDIKDVTEEDFISPYLVVYNNDEVIDFINPVEEQEVSFEDNSNPEGYWKRLIYRFPFDVCNQENNNLRLCLRLPNNMKLDGSDAIYTCDWKLEDGNVITDWCPHLEEDEIRVSNQIQTLEDKLIKLREKYLNFETRIQNIESTIVLQKYNLNDYNHTQYCSEDIFVYLDLAGTLHFTGKGELVYSVTYNNENASISIENNSPFEDNKQNIKKIIIDKDIVIKNASCLFKGLESLEEFYGDLYGLENMSNMFNGCINLKVFEHEENSSANCYVLDACISDMRGTFSGVKELEKVFLIPNITGYKTSSYFDGIYDSDSKIKVYCSSERPIITFCETNFSEILEKVPVIPLNEESLYFSSKEILKFDGNENYFALINTYNDGTVVTLILTKELPNNFKFDNNNQQHVEFQEKLSKSNINVVSYSFDEITSTDSKYLSNFIFYLGENQRSLTFTSNGEEYTMYYFNKLGSSDTPNLSLTNNCKNIIFDRKFINIIQNHKNPEYYILSSKNNNYAYKIGFEESKIQSSNLSKSSYINTLINVTAKGVDNEEDLTEELFKNYYAGVIVNSWKESKQSMECFCNTGIKAGNKNKFNQIIKYYKIFLNGLTTKENYNLSLISFATHIFNLSNYFNNCKIIYDLREITDFSGKYIISKLNREIEKYKNDEESLIDDYANNTPEDINYLHYNYSYMFADSNVKYLPLGIIIRSQTYADGMFYNCNDIIGEIDFFSVIKNIEEYNEDNNPFGNCATSSVSRLIVNYNIASEPILDYLLSLPNTGRNVIKGIKKKEFLPLRQYDEDNN